MRFTDYQTVAIFMGDVRASALIEVSVEEFLLLRECLWFQEANGHAKKHRKFKQDLRGNGYSIRVFFDPTTKKRMVSLVMVFQCGSFHVWVEEEKFAAAMQEPNIPWALFPFWVLSLKLKQKTEMRCFVFSFHGWMSNVKAPKYNYSKLLPAFAKNKNSTKCVNKLSPPAFRKLFFVGLPITLMYAKRCLELINLMLL